MPDSEGRGRRGWVALAIGGLTIAAAAGGYTWDSHRSVQTLEDRLARVSGDLDEQREELRRLDRRRPARTAPDWSELLAGARRQASNSAAAGDSEGSPAVESEEKQPEKSLDEQVYEADLEQENERKEAQKEYQARAEEFEARRHAGIADGVTFTQIRSALEGVDIPLATGENDGCSQDICSFTLEGESDLKRIQPAAIREVQQAGQFTAVVMMRLPDGAVKLFGGRHADALAFR